MWTLPPAGDVQTSSVEMGENYENAIYFNLETGSKVTRNYDEWDLAFAAPGDEFHVTINGGKTIQVYNTHDTDFSKTTFTALASSPWQWDNPNGCKDSTAIGNWRDAKGNSKKEVYILDLGVLASPRYIKLQLLDADDKTYRFRHAAIDNQGLVEAVIGKDASTNFVYYSFLLNARVDFEPAGGTWHLLFTRYRHVYYDMDPVTPYSVTGVLINTRKVTVIETRTLAFEEINHENASKLSFTSKADEIGYDWKFFDLNGTNLYTVDAKKVYIIKDDAGVYYKLKFIGFYNERGIKGTPKFIYQRL